MNRALRTVLLTSALLGLTSGCGNLSRWFFAELEEPAICKTVIDVPMERTQPGQELVKRVPPIALSNSIPLFDSDQGGVEFKLLSLEFVGKQGIQDFNSVDAAWINVLDASDNVGPELIRYDRTPGVLIGNRLTIGGTTDIDLVPFLTSGGEISVEARMTGALPPNPWFADVTACLYTKARINYLDAYGLDF